MHIQGVEVAVGLSDEVLKFDPAGEAAIGGANGFRVVQQAEGGGALGRTVILARA